MRVNIFINVYTIIYNKTNIEMLRKENKIYQKNRAKMFGFSEFLDYLDILGRYYNTFYVEEQ